MCLGQDLLAPISISIDDEYVRKYWALMSYVCQHAPMNVAMDDAIAEWESYAVKVAHCVSAGVDIPPVPSARVWHCWLIHMLQPEAYRQDCLEAFGFVLPHDMRNLSLREMATDKNEVKEKRRFRHVRWANGRETVSILLNEAQKVGLDSVLESSMPLSTELSDYRRYLVASDTLKKQEELGSGPVALSPTVAIDVVWHAHQCNPVAYAADLKRAGLRFINHEPCGELNPPDVAWQQNTRDTWKKLFGSSLSADCFGGGMCNDDAFYSTYDDPDDPSNYETCEVCGAVVWHQNARGSQAFGTTLDGRRACARCKASPHAHIEHRKRQKEQLNLSKPRGGPGGAPKPRGGPGGAPKPRGDPVEAALKKDIEHVSEVLLQEMITVLHDCGIDAAVAAALKKQDIASIKDLKRLTKQELRDEFGLTLGKANELLARLSEK